MKADPRFAVVYDAGSASPLEIARGLKALGTIQFVVPDTPHVQETMPLLRQCGEVIALDEALQWDSASLGSCPDAVLTFSEMMLTQTARLRQRLGLIGHSLDCAKALTDKGEQRRALRQAGVDALRYRVIEDLADLSQAIAEVGLPAVIKPVRSEGSRNTFPIESANQAEMIVSRLGGKGSGDVFIVEERLQGREMDGFGDYVSVESVVVEGKAHHIAITGQFPLAAPFRETGKFWPPRLAAGEQEQIEELTSAALAALGVRSGICHTEIKLTASRPRLIEVNGRLGGFVPELAYRSCGLDLVHVAGMAALGQDPGLPPIHLDQVFFQYHNPAPLFPCVLDSVDGSREVTQMPGVDSYRPLIRPGTRLGSEVGSVRLDALHGRATSHADMLGLVDHATHQLRFSFTETGEAGETTQHVLTGRQLAEAR